MTQQIEVVKTDLEIEEHIKSHKTGFQVQKVGLLVIFCMVISAALGLFGDGILSKKTITRPETSVTYQKFYRYEATMELKVDIHRMQGVDNRIVFPGDYLRHMEIKSVVPSPKSNRALNGQVEYMFEGTGPMTIKFYFTPKDVGSVKASLDVNGNKFDITHFIYP